MPIVTSRFGGCVAASVAFLFGVSVARADIVFCNQFEQTIWVAIAYPQDDGSWLSRGWLELATGDCAPFDTAIRAKTFYYRAKSIPDRSSRFKMTWGKSDKKFAIWDRDNFQYWNAEERVLKSSLADFSQGPETNGDELSVTVTFDANGSAVTLR
jgi:uncharacterized membrane protein